MSRLIDGNTLLEHLEACLTNGRPVTTLYDLREIVKYVDSMPTIDAVEVVRCKDCKWYHAWKENGNPQGYGFCIIDGMKPHIDDWFCADGLRKDGADDGEN